MDGSFLYIDCDTIICDDLSSVENEPFETAGVLDGHCMLDEHIHRKYFLQRDKKLGFHGTAASNCNINGGLVLAKEGDQQKELFRQWNEIWKYSAYEKKDKHDQSALNEANYRTGLKMGHLDGKWNCQPSHGGLAFLKDAKIIHYYSSEFSGKNYIPYYKLADKALQNRIKEEGTIPEDIKEMIADPKFQFNSVHLINDQRIDAVPTCLYPRRHQSKAARTFQPDGKPDGFLKRNWKKDKKALGHKDEDAFKCPMRKIEFLIPYLPCSV